MTCKNVKLYKGKSNMNFDLPNRKFITELDIAEF